MDFDQATKAHTDWRAKLSAYLRKPDGSIRANDIGLDNKCEWIVDACIISRYVK